MVRDTEGNLVPAEDTCIRLSEQIKNVKSLSTIQNLICKTEIVKEQNA